MNPVRNGRFTSSEIVALTGMGRRLMTDEEIVGYKKANPKSTAKYTEDGFSEAGLTYIQECNWERRTGQPIEREANAKATSWGKIAEDMAFMQLGQSLEYRMCSQETLQHPKYDYWVGSPDCEKFTAGNMFADTIVDIKCPYTLRSFCKLADCVEMVLQDGIWVVDDSKERQLKSVTNLRNNHKEGEKYYWQIVSNACITGATRGELIAFMPYKEDLQEMRDMASNRDGADQWAYKYIADGMDDELPHLLNGYHYKNMYKICFEIPQADKDYLESRVVAASKLLEPFYNQIIEGL